MVLVYTQNMLRLSINVNRNLLRTTRTVQKLAECKFSRLAHNSTNVSLRNNFLFNVHKHSRVHGIYVVRHQSTIDSTVKETVPSTPKDVPTQYTESTIANVNTTEANQNFISEIPDAPIPPSEEITTAVAQALTATGEPTFTSLGLGGYGPVGIVEYCLEWLHIGCDMPWWGAIVTLTVIVKLLMIPPTIKQARNNAKMMNVLPEMMKIQNQMSEARACGNKEEAALYAYDLQALLRKNDINMLSFTTMFMRLILHVPVFMALREMANLPVESLKTGGLWWFADLTTVDQYYLLPVLTSVGLYLVTENAMRSANAATMGSLSRYFIRGLPVITFLFAMNFPGTVLCYWVLSNFITVIQNEVLKMKSVKAYLNIPIPKVHKNIAEGILKQKSFVESFKESWTNMKISNKMANHLRADEVQFNEAAKGPLKKTFKYNPQQVASARTSVKSVAAMKK